jgi:hypothetical protein
VGLFFGDRSPSSLCPLTICGHIRQIGGQLPPTTSNGFLIQPCDLTEFAITGLARLLGQHPDIPATLGFIQMAEQQVYASML